MKWKQMGGPSKSTYCLDLTYDDLVLWLVKSAAGRADEWEAWVEHDNSTMVEFGAVFAASPAAAKDEAVRQWRHWLLERLTESIDWEG